MERWSGRVALVTGASAGIGAAVAYQLQDHGVHVVAVARRVDKIEEAVAQAKQDAKSRGRYHETEVKPGKLYAKKCDVSKEEDILALFKWIKETLGGVDILINNAALGKDTGLTDAPTADWKVMLDLNVLGLSICTREAVQNMRARGVDDGHIVHISSVAGHQVGVHTTAMYSATKHAVMALTEGLRKDFVEHKSNMKVSCVSPGVVRTEFLNNLPMYNTEEFRKLPCLYSEDVGDAILYVLGTPPHVQLIEADRRTTVLQISYGSVLTIIRKNLGFRKVFARWVPKLLNDDQKAKVDMTGAYVEKFTRLSSNLLENPFEIP